MGFSAGAIVAVDFALHHSLPGRLGGVVGVASSVLPEMTITIKSEVMRAESKQTPMLITHGEADDRVLFLDTHTHTHAYTPATLDVGFASSSHRPRKCVERAGVGCDISSLPEETA